MSQSAMDRAPAPLELVKRGNKGLLTSLDGLVLRPSQSARECRDFKLLLPRSPCE